MQINTNIPPLPEAKKNQPSGFCQSVIADFQAKKISWEDTEKYIALRTSKTLEDHMPIEYTAMDPGIFAYCNDRERDLIARDHDRAVKNGTWLIINLRLLTKNKAEYEYLDWARLRCIDAGSKSAADRIAEHMEKFVQNSFPDNEFVLALKVQRKDSDDRRRSVYSKG